MSYCIYLRKSRADVEAEARGEGETLARHEKILLGLAKKLQINVTKIYKEIVSGETIAARPVMQQLLTDIENGNWKGVLVVEVERLARGDTMDQGLVAQTLKYSGTKIITPVKTYDPSDEFDEEYFEFGLFMSRREYKTINRRLQRGRFQSIKEGKYLGNIPPYGYARKKIHGGSGYTLEPCQDEAMTVRLIYDWYTGSERLGIAEIRDRLNDLRVPTRRGRDWTNATLRNILTNPVYIGKVRWKARPCVKEMENGEINVKRPRSNEPTIADGLHEAIISEDVYQAAQARLAENSTAPVPGRRTLMNPLAGLIVCGMCGRRMIRRPYQDGYPDTLMCTGPTCPNISTHLHLVEERLIQALVGWLHNYKLEIKEALQETETDSEIKLIERTVQSLDSELETLNKQLNNLHDLLEQGVYTVEVFLARSEIISNKIKTAMADKEQLESKLENLSRREKDKEIIIPQVEKVIDEYWGLPTAKEKNNILKDILDKVLYTKKVNGRWHGSPSDFELVLYPKLPK